MRYSPIVYNARRLRHRAVDLSILAVVVAGCSQAPPSVSSDKVPWLDVDKQIELLDESDYRLRALAARNLGKLGADAEKAIPRLEALVNDPESKVRDAANESLDQIRAAIGEENTE